MFVPPLVLDSPFNTDCFHVLRSQSLLFVIIPLPLLIYLVFAENLYFFNSYHPYTGWPDHVRIKNETKNIVANSDGQRQETQYRL
jgi:hypothetical protein